MTMSTRLRSVISVESLTQLIQSVVAAHAVFVRTSSTLARPSPTLDTEIDELNTAIRALISNGPIEVSADDRGLMSKRISRAIIQVYKQPGLTMDEPSHEPDPESLPHTILARMRNSIDQKISERLSRRPNATFGAEELLSLRNRASKSALKLVERSLKKIPLSLSTADEALRDATNIATVLNELPLSPTERNDLESRAESYRDHLYERPPHAWAIPLKRLSAVVVRIVEEFASGSGSVGARESTEIDLFSSLKVRSEAGQSPPMIALIKWAMTPEAEKLTDTEFEAAIRKQLLPQLTTEEKRYTDGFAAELEIVRDSLPIEQIIMFDKVRPQFVARIRSRVFQQLKGITDKSERNSIRETRMQQLIHLSIQPLKRAFAQEYLQPLARNRAEFEARMNRILNSASRGLLAEEALSKKSEQAISEPSTPKVTSKPALEVVTENVPDPVSETALEPEIIDEPEIVAEPPSEVIQNPVTPPELVVTNTAKTTGLKLEQQNLPKVKTNTRAAQSKTLDNEEEFWKRYKNNGDLAARETIAKHYLGLVDYALHRMKRRISNPSVLEELGGAGREGLFDAMEKYNLANGVKFDTYAPNRIEGAMLDQLRKLTWQPRLVNRRFNILSVAKQIFANTNAAAEPSREELKSILISPDFRYRLLNPSERRSGATIDEAEVDKRAETILNDGFNTISMGSTDKEIRTNGSSRATTLGQSSEDVREENPLDSLSRENAWDNIRKGFGPTERLIITLYFKEGLSMKETAKVVGFGESRISQKVAVILNKLKTRYAGREQELRDALIPDTPRGPRRAEQMTPPGKAERRK